MGVIIEGNFTKPATNSCSATEPYRDPPVSIDGNTATVDASRLGAAETVMPKAYVKMRVDHFRAMLEAMHFYSQQGFDHGERAKDFLNRSMKNYD